MGSRFWCVLFALVVSASGARADRIKLRVGTLAVEGSRYTQDIRALGKEIESRTRRAVRIDWVTGGQLGDEQQMAAKIRDGTLDGAGLSETGLIALVPEMAAWQYAGLFRDYADVDRATVALDPTVRELFGGRKLTFAMWADLGFAHVFSIDPITNLREVLKTAAPHLTVPLDGNLTASIIAGRASAWALPPLYMMAIGPTKARSMTSLRYRYVVGGLVFGGAAWSKLSPAKQKAVLDVCREWEPKLRASWRRETEAGIAALTKVGVRTRVSSDAEVTSFFDASARARGAHAQGATKELVAKIVASLAR